MCLYTKLIIKWYKCKTYRIIKLDMFLLKINELK